VFTGYSAERLYELKMIPGETFKAAQAKAMMTEQIRSWNELPSADFDRALLQELRARLDAAPKSAATGGA
jgi:hypothetical protein